MKNRKTAILFILFIIISTAAIFRHAFREIDPDSREAFEKGIGKYEPLKDKNGSVEGWFGHRMTNGLLIHVKKKGSGYEPKLGVYQNAEGAKVHVQEKLGFITVHTHAAIPSYELGTNNFGEVTAKIVQIPPEHYDKGPSKFVMRLNKKFIEGIFKGTIEHNGKEICNEVKNTIINSRNRMLTFPKAYTEYPKGAVIRVSFENNGSKTEIKYPLHELPPRNTLSRSFVN